MDTNTTTNVTTTPQGSTPGPLATRQGTMQETYAGSWIVSHEGSPVIKRGLRFVEDDADAGWELLGGEYDALADTLASAPTMRARIDALELALREVLDEYTGRCSHDEYGIEDCAACRAHALLAPAQEGRGA